MSEGIYHDEIKTLAKSDSGPGKLEQPDSQVTIDNPLCGDRVRIELCVDGDRISAEAHNVKGCLLCRASANAIGSAAVGLSAADVDKVSGALKAMLKGDSLNEWPLPGWEALDLFQPVSSHKSRHECVMLPFKALAAALEEV